MPLTKSPKSNNSSPSGMNTSKNLVRKSSITTTTAALYAASKSTTKGPNYSNSKSSVNPPPPPPSTPTSPTKLKANFTSCSLHTFTGEPEDAWLNASPYKANDQRVLIIYTGGTMGMAKSVDGSLKPEPGYLTERIRNMAEFQSKKMPHCRINEYDVLIDSAEMGYDDMARIARDIEKEYFNYDGFVVIMGTDTMAYAATALSFMLENLAKTVVFTGSQIPFAEVFNDARRNLIASILFAGNMEFSEVCLCFNNTLLRGNRSVKVNSFGLAAFESPNFPPLATLGVNTMFRKDIALPPPRAPFRAAMELAREIFVVALTPSFHYETLECVVKHSVGLKGIVIQFFGTGNGPSAPSCGLVRALSSASSRGIIIVAVSQCLKGSVFLNMYEASRQFERLGVVSGGDMTKEAASVKLSYLLGKEEYEKKLEEGEEDENENNDIERRRERVRRGMMEDLRGELSDAVLYKTGFTV